jgi:DTW domain-containing protein YfiP
VKTREVPSAFSDCQLAVDKDMTHPLTPVTNTGKLAQVVIVDSMLSQWARKKKAKRLYFASWAPQTQACAP